MSGTLFSGHEDGMVFLGASHFDNEKPAAYGKSPAANMVGVLRLLDAKRLLLELPSKSGEYTFVELMRGTPAPAGRRTNKEIADNFMRSERCRGNATNPEQRVEACTQLLADPREHHYYPMHHHWRGQGYVGKKDYASAIRDFNESIRLMPEAAHAYMDRGIAYWVMEGNSKTGEFLQKAKADLDKAIVNQPTLARAWFVRGMIKLDEREFQGALSDLDRAVLLDPDNPKAYIERAEAKRQLGDIKGSEEDVTKSVALDSRRQGGNPKAPVLAPQREKLDGFGDVKFGAPATAAKAALGAKAKSAAARGSDGFYVSSDIVHEGVAYTLNYYFTSHDKMVRVEFFPREGFTNSKAQCMAATEKMIATFNRRFGNPDKDETKGETREIEYNFKDGTQALIQSFFFELGSFCSVLGNYSVLEGRLKKVEAK
jgi:tetratricopeptide (TPR) repeat protein